MSEALEGDSDDELSSLDDDEFELDDAEPEPPEPYLHDASQVPDLATVLDRSCIDLTKMRDWESQVQRAVAHLGPNLGQPALDELRILAWYRIKVDRAEDGSAGALLEPVDVPGWPRPISVTPEPARELWRELADEVTEPIATARLHDLCFTAKIGRGDLHAKTAAQAYLDHADVLVALERGPAIARAWTLARSVRDDDLARAAVEKAVVFAEQLVSDEDAGPGTLLPLLAVAADRPPDELLDRVAAVLATASGRWGESYLQVKLCRLRRQITTDPEERKAIDRDEVLSFLADADANSARSRAVEMHHLDRAANVARRLNVKDLEAVAISRMQAIDPDDLGMVPIRARSQIPREFAETWIGQFDDAHDWREALVGFLSMNSPSGEVEQNTRLAENQAQQGFLHRMFPKVRMGVHGLPQQHQLTDDEKLADDLVWFETVHMGLEGSWHNAMLERIPENFGPIERDDIAVFLAEHYNCPLDSARVFATALDLHWRGEYLAAAQVAVPLVEAGTRDLLRLLDEPLYRVETGKTIGQFPGLGALLPHLAKHDFDPNWERFLGTLLLPRGENLRNLLAHGFLNEVGPTRSALVLRAAGLMLGLTPGDNVDPMAARQSILDLPASHPPPGWGPIALIRRGQAAARAFRRGN